MDSDEKRFGHRAKELRELAAMVQGDHQKKQLLEAARTYERLARQSRPAPRLG
jgi:hypothetical protein